MYLSCDNLFKDNLDSLKNRKLIDNFQKAPLTSTTVLIIVFWLQPCIVYQINEKTFFKFFQMTICVVIMI